MAIDVAFAGREWDNDAGFYYNRARWYDPVMGRFISEDPIGFAGGDANLYRYAAGDPVNFRDPSGLFFDKIIREVKRVYDQVEDFVDDDLDQLGHNIDDYVNANGGWPLFIAEHVAVATIAASVTWAVGPYIGWQFGQIVVGGAERALGLSGTVRLQSPDPMRYFSEGIDLNAADASARAGFFTTIASAGAAGFFSALAHAAVGGALYEDPQRSSDTTAAPADDTQRGAPNGGGESLELSSFWLVDPAKRGLPGIGQSPKIDINRLLTGRGPNWNQGDGPLHYHEAEIEFTIRTRDGQTAGSIADDIFRHLQLFDLFNRGHNGIAEVETRGNGYVYFNLLGPWKGKLASDLLARNDDEVAVRVTQNPLSRTVFGTTAGDHQLVGQRRWNVLARPTGDGNSVHVKIMTRAFERPRSSLNYLGF